MENAGIKDAAKRLVEELPEDATWDDLMYRIYVRQAIEAGLRDSDAGGTMRMDEVRAMAAWHEVFEGLSEDDVTEIENMALDRSRFSREDS